MFHDPWVLLLLAFVPLIVWRLRAGRNASAVNFSSIDFADQLKPSLRQRVSWLPSALTVIAIMLMIVALARPREGREQAVIDSEGIAIEMVVDRSGSMQAMDFQIDGQRVDRLTAIKNVAGKFVTGDESAQDSSSLTGRVSDLVGLISFARYADAQAPPTLDHGFLVSKLSSLEIVNQRSEDGTAIGDAISLAVEKLDTLDDRRDEKIKSKVVVLLTDGENNAGDFDPIPAAELASKMKIRIYTIGVGTRGQAPVPVVHPLTGQTHFEMMQVNIDEKTLRQIADLTGGKYFRATNTESLQAIYSEIDQLEKTKVEAQHYVDFRELAIQSIPWSTWTVPSLVLMAILVLSARLILVHTVFRRLA